MANPIIKNIEQIINHFDANHSREGLKDTPKRYYKFLKEFLNPKPFNFTIFDSEGYNNPIICKDISFFSLCEHHLAPFYGVAHVAYIPDGKIVGLSKIPRLVDKCARSFQNQERITKQICNELEEALKPKGVAVILEAEHLCMAMRGIQKIGVKTRTIDFRGDFKKDDLQSLIFS